MRNSFGFASMPHIHRRDFPQSGARRLLLAVDPPFSRVRVHNNKELICRRDGRVVETVHSLQQGVLALQSPLLAG